MVGLEHDTIVLVNKLSKATKGGVEHQHFSIVDNRLEDQSYNYSNIYSYG